MLDLGNQRSFGLGATEDLTSARALDLGAAAPPSVRRRPVKHFARIFNRPRLALALEQLRAVGTQLAN